MGVIAAAFENDGHSPWPGHKTRIIRPQRPHRIKPVRSARPPRADLREQFFFMCEFSSSSL
jgi:hypothetical protein